MKTAKSFYFEISDNEKDTMDLVSKLFKKLGIEFKKVNLVLEKQTLDYLEKENKKNIEASYDDFFSKYVGIVKGSTTDEEVKEYRINKYAK